MIYISAGNKKKRFGHHTRMYMHTDTRKVRKEANKKKKKWLRHDLNEEKRRSKLSFGKQPKKKKINRIAEWKMTLY